MQLSDEIKIRGFGTERLGIYGMDAEYSCEIILGEIFDEIESKNFYVNVVVSDMFELKRRETKRTF